VFRLGGMEVWSWIFHNKYVNPLTDQLIWQSEWNYVVSGKELRQMIIHCGDKDKIKTYMKRKCVLSCRMVLVFSCRSVTVDPGPGLGSMSSFKMGNDPRPEVSSERHAAPLNFFILGVCLRLGMTGTGY
jgi:hypothetical protein